MNFAIPEVVDKIRSCKCQSSGKSLNYLFCYVKTFKKVSTMNIGINKLRKFGMDFKVLTIFSLKIIFNSLMNPLQVTITLDRKYSTGRFEPVYNLENIEWCKVSKATKLNPFLKSIITSFGETSVKVFIEDFCVKLGELKAMNITIPKNLL